MKSDYASAYHNRGNALVTLERYEDALADYEKAIELKPDDPSSHQNTAEAYLVTNRPQEAFEKLIEARSHIDNPKDRATTCYLTCLATKLLNRDTTAADVEFESAMKEDFKRTFGTDIIERWLETAELDDDTREYIEE